MGYVVGMLDDPDYLTCPKCGHRIFPFMGDEDPATLNCIFVVVQKALDHLATCKVSA